ncbi:SAM-dependent methyltransferase [Desulfobaculum xiamenense]|uniref:SAM-dependent methyltransferase n=1 Tax=Desulfobaculum xiamenense TaxID=995050 RepID=A0A846QJX8_9BACT|nr:class I SAM-dependent methyltransferase [Desulfobaculum xiamenense]NJB69206.1 SAM-dependent methyltransferase [Desulfobaculum xiamenense]
MTLRESDIRPDELRSRLAEAASADARWLARRVGSFVLVPCPACQCVEQETAMQKEGMTWRRCLACGTLYVSPRPDEDLLARYYARSESYRFQNAVLFPASAAARAERIFAPRARRCEELCERMGLGRGLTLVEVGPGFGLFAQEVRKLGRFSRIVVVEPVPELAATCRALGVEVVESTVERAGLPDGMADVVVSFECIEHMFSVAGFFEACLRVLRPGGLFVVTCPNGEGFDISILGSRSGTVNHQHLNLFNTRSLPYLARRCGFEVLDVTTPGELDVELVRREVLAGRFDLDDRPFLRWVLMDEWGRIGGAFQRFLADNGMSSHMWMAARRPEAS